MTVVLCKLIYIYYKTKKGKCPPLVDRVAIVAEVVRFASRTWDFGTRLGRHNTEKHISSITKGGWQKGAHPPQKRWQKGGHCFSSTARFSLYMWSLASIQRPSRMYALPRYTILHIFTITVSEQPNAQRPVAQALSSQKQSNVRNIPVTYVSDLRTASVCFIQEKPHNIPCMLNRGGKIHQLVEPVLWPRSAL